MRGLRFAGHGAGPELLTDDVYQLHSPEHREVTHSFAQMEVSEIA